MTHSKAVRLLIFAKAPQPGLAKTRLIPSLGAVAAAHLAARMLQTTVQQACMAQLGPVELCVSPAPWDAAWAGYASTLPPELIWQAQGEGDLGQRLARASTRATREGQAVLLIGTDCVEMSADLLRDAAQALQTHDAVLYPTVDGGYALLGLRHAAPTLFEDVAWSTSTVAASTMAKVAALGWSLAVGPWLHDVDEPADLAHLPPAWQLSHG